MSTSTFNDEILPLLTSDRLYGFCLRLTRDRSTADDLVQNVSLRAWRSRASYVANSNPWAWVATIARNQAITSAKSEAARQLMIGSGAQVISADSDWDEQVSRRALSQAQELDAESQIDSDRRLDDLLQRIARLHPERAEILHRRILLEEDCKSIAADLGIKPATVATRKIRALRQLRREIEGGVEPRPQPAATRAAEEPSDDCSAVEVLVAAYGCDLGETHRCATPTFDVYDLSELGLELDSWMGRQDRGSGLRVDRSEADVQRSFEF
jgi:RNA polymerase sigma-70 factor (ECF subfamily)